MSATINGNGDPGLLALPPLAVGPEAAAALIGISRRGWGRLCSAGKAPAPIKIGRCRRWSVETLNRWVLEGCPARDPDP